MYDTDGEGDEEAPVDSEADGEREGVVVVDPLAAELSLPLLEGVDAGEPVPAADTLAVRLLDGVVPKLRDAELLGVPVPPGLKLPLGEPVLLLDPLGVPVAAGVPAGVPVPDGMAPKLREEVGAGVREEAAVTDGSRVPARVGRLLPLVLGVGVIEALLVPGGVPLGVTVCDPVVLAVVVRSAVWEPVALWEGEAPELSEADPLAV